jgi:hypothetical protein
MSIESANGPLVVVNGENASYQGEKFSAMRTRTRKALLTDLAEAFQQKGTLKSVYSISNWKIPLFGTHEQLVTNTEAKNSREAVSLPQSPVKSPNSPTSPRTIDAAMDDQGIEVSLGLSYILTHIALSMPFYSCIMA